MQDGKTATSVMGPRGVPSRPPREIADHHGWRRRMVAGLVTADVAVLFGVGLLGVLARYGVVTDVAVYGNEVQLPYLGLCVLLTPVWVLMLALSGAYGAWEVGTGTDEYRRLIEGTVRFVALLAVVAYAIHLDLSRLFVAIVAPLGLAGVLTIHWGARRWLHNQRANGRFVRQIVVVGSEANAAELVRHFRRAPYVGMAVVGTCTGDRGSAMVVDDLVVPVVAHPTSLVADAVALGAHALVFADTHVRGLPSMRTIACDLEGTGTALIVAPSVVEVAGPRIAVRPVAGLPLLHVEEPRLEGPTRLLKQLVERIAAGVILLLISPLLLAIGICVRLTSKGPALFRQVRIGRGGKPFTMLKFRTMVTGAEQGRQEFAHLNEAEGPLFKIRCDPRVTPLGRCLRRFSLDELPQVLHVVTGVMSIVGPRPPLPAEMASYDSLTKRRLLVPPGLTGLWQVSGRSDLSWQESIRLDLYYVENWSLWLDLVILAKTLLAVVRGRGAY
jgi:exopolysaccharide biosynthesis polyprenyl glycosylphosphotransferase